MSAVFSGDMRTMRNEVTEGEGRHDERPDRDRNWSDEVRHKLLSQTDLTLRDAIRIAEQKKRQRKRRTVMAQPMPMNVMKMSNYRRQKQNRDVTKSAAEEEKKATANRGRCKTAVGIFIHIQGAQLLIKGVTNASNLDIFT